MIDIFRYTRNSGPFERLYKKIKYRTISPHIVIRSTISDCERGVPFIDILEFVLILDLSKRK